MSQQLKIDHFVSLNIKEVGKLDADAAAGATVLVLVNNNLIAANDPIYFGNFGNETGEVKKAQSVTGATGVTLTAGLSFKHVRFEQFAVLFADQIKVYRSPNTNGLQPADNTFTLLGTATTIDYDQPSTLITDAAGNDAYWYKSTFFNSVSSLETDLSASRAIRGGEYGNYCSTDDIRKEAGFTRAPYITDEMIDTQRQAAQAVVNGALVGIYALPFVAPINPLIRTITIRLAAGWLLLEQYGHTGTRSTQDGQAKIDSVMNAKKTGDLDKLQIGSLKLTNSNGSDTTASNTANGFNGWPNATTATADPLNGGSDFAFRRSDVDGYQTRNY